MTRSTYWNNMLGRFGYQPQSSTAYNWAAGLGMLGVGLAVGAGVGMLMAPKAGSELRGDLSRSASRLTDKIRSRIPALSEDANHVYDRNPSIG